MRAISFARFVLLFALLGLFLQCTDDHQERFEDPPWLEGTNIETLEASANYTQFLALIDKADYRTSLENQMFTLFVPNDSSFQIYFQERGITSVDDLSVDEAEELFGQHILINGRGRDQLMYEYSGEIWGELESPEGEYGTLFHRKETYSVPLDYSEEVRYHEVFQGEILKLYRERTLVPLFTTEYMEDYFGDPSGSDYTFMYPGSEWSGTQWHNAMVTEIGRTSTGFIYYLDKVVPPIPTIEKYLLDNQDKYGVFFDLAQRFADYGGRRVDEQNIPTYQKSYNQILNFADEYGPNPGFPQQMLYMFTAFIPKDDVMQDYLDRTVLQDYPSVDSAPQLYLVYLLQAHLNSFLGLPTKIDERFINYLGDEINIDINADINNSIMCSNGIIYGMNKMLEPNVFTCVPGPLFYDKDYTTFLYALENSGLLSFLAAPDEEFVLFAVNNDRLMEYGIRENVANNIAIIEKRGTDGVWYALNSEDLEDFVKDHIFIGNKEDFLGEGYLRMTSNNYVHYKDGAIRTGGNQVIGDNAQVLEKHKSDINGNMYYLNNSLKVALNAAKIIMADPELTSFTDLLTQAELIDSVQDDYQSDVLHARLPLMTELNQWTIFAPTNDAIAAANQAGIIPTEKEELREFIYYHFVREKCVFDDGVFSGTVSSHLLDTVIGTDRIFEKLQIVNAVYNLTVTDKSGKQVAVSHGDANALVTTGVLHKIDAVLTIE